MGLFDRLGGGQQQPAQQQQITPEMMQREVNSIKNNPVDYLRQRGFQIPNGMNDPKQITQYMLQNGMIGTGRLQQVMRMIGAPMGR